MLDLTCTQTTNVVLGLDPGNPAKPSYQVLLEKSLGMKNQSCV